MTLDCKHKQADDMKDYYFLDQLTSNQVTFGLCRVLDEKSLSDDENHKMLTKYLKLPVINKLCMSTRHFIMITAEERDLL